MPGAIAPVFRLFFNAREAFPYPSPSTTTKTWDWRSSPHISTALLMLPEDERAAVFRYHRRGDASLALGSYLLKHLAIVRACPGVRWSDSAITQDREVCNGKPFFAPGGISFNVSHQGDVVVLIGSTRPNARVGIDVVKADLEKDRPALVREGGFANWVRMYRDMFSAAELYTLTTKYTDDPRLRGDELTRARLRQFYATWACKEAYIKLTGDALGADFLHELEFTTVTVPQPSHRAAERPDAPGEVTTTLVTMGGRLVKDVRVEIQAIGKDYMVATAIEGDDCFPDFEKVDLAREILPYAAP